MERSPRPDSRIYVISWPAEVTPRDVARVRGYAAEGFPAGDSAARVLIERATTSWTTAKARAVSKLSRSPDRLWIVNRNLDELYSFYVGPANDLLRAREIEARGPVMPPLLDPKVDAIIEHLATVNPAKTINVLRGIFIEGALKQWQEEVRLLQVLQRLGPVGLVDLESRRLIELFADTPRGREVVQTVEAGRQRFHQLYEVI